MLYRNFLDEHEDSSVLPQSTNPNNDSGLCSGLAEQYLVAHNQSCSDHHHYVVAHKNEPVPARKDLRIHTLIDENFQI